MDEEEEEQEEEEEEEEEEQKHIGAGECVRVHFYEPKVRNSPRPHQLVAVVVRLRHRPRCGPRDGTVLAHAVPRERVASHSRGHTV